MLVIAQVRLTSHFLGELKPDTRGVRRFKMTSRNHVAVNQTGWLDDLVFAAHTMKMEVNVRRTVVPPEGIIPASIHLLRRSYSGAHVDFFESFRKGTIITFNLMVHEERPRCPDLAQLTQILEFVGVHCGISQWGKKFGFGRFSIVKVADQYAPDGGLPSPDKTPGLKIAPRSNTAPPCEDQCVDLATEPPVSQSPTDSPKDPPKLQSSAPETP